jgi:hypothetical protein
MEESHFGDVIALDKACFSRPGGRSSSNLSTLNELSHGGSFVGLLGGRVVAYVFTHRFGTVGVIGPLGVEIQHRGKGYGKLLVERARSHLMQACVHIGLEVLPTSAPALALYYSLGFAIESVTLQFLPTKRACLVVKNMSVVAGIELGEGAIDRYMADYEAAFDGYGYAEDVGWLLRNQPASLFFLICGNEVAGFMSYSPDLSRCVWGAMPSFNLNQFEFLYSEILRANQSAKIPFRVNANTEVIRQLLGGGYELDRVLLRLSTGPDRTTKPLADLRSWVG